MKTLLPVFVLGLTLGVLGPSPAAMAQSDLPQPASGATAPDQAGAASATAGSSHASPIAPDLQGAIRDRSGRDQNELELSQTTLLNQFGQLGFADMRNFRKDGAAYVAEVQTVEGIWQTVEIDPASGNVTTRQ